jgi:very-short-patch-repair endonuclease
MRDTAVMTADQLRRRGVRRSEVERALLSGDLLRVRRGWYATAAADPSIVAAVRAGGRLTCVSLLGRCGVWVMDDATVHVRVPKGRSVQRRPDIRLHWTQEPLALEEVLDAPDDALDCAVHCLDLAQAVAVADSAVNVGLLTMTAAERRLSRSPRGRRILEHWDPRAESGLETLMRLALRAARLRVRSQVRIGGIGRVDLLVGDRLVMELDGAAWHGGVADFERDRARDRALMARGCLIMRASYRQVMSQRPMIVGQVLELVRRREHLWQVTQRRAAQLGQERPAAHR